MKKVRILIIDDDADTLETLGDILQEKGYVTETAKTGKEALTKAESMFFNVALVDMKLPDVIGTEVLRKLRKKYPSMITIVITGHATLQSAIDSLNLGVNGYIRKPIDVENVDAMIKKLVKSFEMSDSLRKPQILSTLEAQEYFNRIRDAAVITNGKEKGARDKTEIRQMEGEDDGKS